MAYKFFNICSHICLTDKIEMEELMYIGSCQNTALTLKLDKDCFCLSKVRCFLKHDIKIKHLTVV